MTEPSSPEQETFHARCAIYINKAHIEAFNMTAKPKLAQEHFLSTYFSLKHHFIVEPYISQVQKGHLCRTLATFRTGSHWLRVQTGQNDADDFSCRTYDCCEHDVDLL